MDFDATTFTTAGVYASILPEGYRPTTAAYLTVAALALTVLLISTRLVSSLQASKTANSSHESADTVPIVPYWLPFIGHVPYMLFDADGFFKRLRARSLSGIFALNFGGTRHNIMFTPALASAFFGLKTSHVDAEQVSESFMVNIFGYPRREKAKYHAALDELQACYKHLQTEPYLGEMAAGVTREVCEHANNLVTGMDSPVDQMPWEKSAYIHSTTHASGEAVVEASLLPLIRDFCATMANKVLFGTDLLANSPQLLDDLWILDAGFFLLATGLPRWAPIPALTRAHIARRRLLQEFESFHKAMEIYSRGDDPGPKWSSLHDVGSLIKARMDVYQKYDLSIKARASIEHALLWAANANSNTLVFWMINHIYQSPELLSAIRTEIAPYVHISRPSNNGLPIQEPVKITSIDRDGLYNKCPHLKSIYVECLRLDTASWSLKVVKQDTVLQSREKGAQPWLLKKGDYVHAAHDLHNTDPKYFDEPTVWKSNRHIKINEQGELTADLGSIRPYGGGSSMCKGRQLALQEVMLFTACIVAMWDIQAAKGGPWVMPTRKRATGVYSASSDTRVWIKQRAATAQ